MGVLISRPIRFGEINARCRALKSTLLGREFYERVLLSKTVGDLQQMLQESAYAPFLHVSGKAEIERGIDRAFSRLYDRSTVVLRVKERTIFDLFFVGRKKLPEKRVFLVEEQTDDAAYKAVDIAYIGRIREALNQLGRGEREDLKEIIGSYFDLLNLYTLVRLRILYRMEPEEILPFLLPYGLRFDMKTLGAAAGLSTLAEISALLHDRFGTTFESYHVFRQVVARYHITLLRKVWYGYPFKISVIFSLLRLKEIEIENLKALVEGIHYQLPAEEIKKMLVGL